MNNEKKEFPYIVKDKDGKEYYIPCGITRSEAEKAGFECRDVPE